MRRLVVSFEILSLDFDRAMKFYETIVEVKLFVYSGGNEKMACFSEDDGKSPGSISYTPGFKPSENGVLVSLNCKEIDNLHAGITANGGEIVIPKTKIEAEGRGYFSVFIDCEGNRIRLYSVN